MEDAHVAPRGGGGRLGDAAAELHHDRLLEAFDLGMNHAKLATQFVDNHERAQWHDRALWFVRQKRDKMVQTVPEWERLRELAAQVKAEGQSIHDRLERLYEQHGIHQERTLNLRMEGSQGMQRMTQLMAALRNQPPTQ